MIILKGIDITTQDDPPLIAKRYKQLFLALLYSPILAYLIYAYLNYRGYKKHDSDYTVSSYFFTSTAEYMLSDIVIALRFLWLPYVWVVVIPYVIVFYIVFTSKRVTVEKYRTLLLTLLLVLFYLFTKEYSSFIASSI